MKYTFKFKRFGDKVQMFAENDMGIVIEKEPEVVCVYGTTEDYRTILCAIPLCPPKLLKGAGYTLEFCTGQCAKISVGDVKLVIDFGNRKCSNNLGVQCYGSDAWGREVALPWDGDMERLFS